MTRVWLPRRGKLSDMLPMAMKSITDDNYEPYIVQDNYYTSDGPNNYTGNGVDGSGFTLMNYYSSSYTDNLYWFTGLTPTQSAGRVRWRQKKGSANTYVGALLGFNISTPYVTNGYALYVRYYYGYMYGYVSYVNNGTVTSLFNTSNLWSTIESDVQEDEVLTFEWEWSYSSPNFQFDFTIYDKYMTQSLYTENTGNITDTYWSAANLGIYTNQQLNKTSIHKFEFLDSGS